MFKTILKNKWLIRSIGIVIFILILLFKIDFKTLTQIVKIDYCYLIGAIAILLLSSIIRPIRWQYILKKLNIKYPFGRVFQLYYIGVLIGNITPGKLGELGKIAYLKKDGHSINDSLISTIIDKIIDMFFLIIVSCIGIFFLRQFLQIDILFAVIIIVIGLSLIAIIIKTRAYEALVKKLRLTEFIKGLKVYKFKNYLCIFFITIIYWLSHYLIMYLLAKSVGINQLSFLYLAISVTIANIVILLPISILGIGTRDISLLFLFSLFGVSAELTISFSALILLIVLINSFIGLVFWLKKPISITR